MTLNRRQLLVNTTKMLAVINTSSLLSFPVITNASGEAELLSFNEEQIKILGLLARSMFPHESLHDSYYLAVAQNIDQQASKNPDLKMLVEDGIRNLHTASGASWPSLAQDKKQKILENMEQSPFFTFVLNTSIDTLYRHPDIWEFVGYEGSSIEYGGYLHRGFDDINWLPQ